MGCPLAGMSPHQPLLKAARFGDCLPCVAGDSSISAPAAHRAGLPSAFPSGNQPQELLRRPWQREDRIPAHIKKFKQGCTDCNSCSVHFHCSDKQAAQEPKEVSLAPCTSLAQGTGRACGKPFIWGLSLRPAWHRAAGGWHLLCVCSALRRRC